jgi:cytochrome P450
LQESILAIGAGSDTVATALANTIFNLVAHPQAMAKLRAEITAAGLDVADLVVDGAKLAELKYLQAVINESLRLEPIVPSGGQRTPPPKGGPVNVAGQYVSLVMKIAPRLLINALSSVLFLSALLSSSPLTAVGLRRDLEYRWADKFGPVHRDPRYFSPDPDEFWPDRWRPEGKLLARANGQHFALEQRAFIPFNYGPTLCVGRLLARHELRAMLVALVGRYDLRFAPGFEAHLWRKQLRDHFVLFTGKLMVIATQRK